MSSRESEEGFSRVDESTSLIATSKIPIQFANRRRTFVGGLFLLGFGVLAFFVGYLSPPSDVNTVEDAMSDASALKGETSEGTKDNFEVNAVHIHDTERSLGFYTQVQGYENQTRTGLPYDFMNSKHMTEPQRKTTVYMTTQSAMAVSSCDWAIGYVSGGGVYDEIPGVMPAHTFSHAGKSQDFDTSSRVGLLAESVILPSPGRYSFEMTCTFEDGIIKKSEDFIDCYYVRRELRNLNKVDLNVFLDTFLVLYNTSTEEGRAKYGKHYHSLDYFVLMHTKTGSAKKVDMIHDGTGIATQHIAISNMFELSMQTVVPHMALPYWDYTIEMTDVQTNGTRYDAEAQIFKQSWIFSDEVFGDSHGYGDHRVSDGRFKDVVIRRDYNLSVRSSYGYLRAPWNLNPSKYVTRFHSFCGYVNTHPSTIYDWPGCLKHFEVTNTDSYSTYYDWVWDIGYSPHGPVHWWIGGSGGGCMQKWYDTMWEAKNSGEYFASVSEDTFDASIGRMKTESIFILKNGYRDNMLFFPEYCSADTDPGNCSFKCRNYGFETAQDIAWWNGIFDFESGMHVYTEADKVKIIQTVCEFPFWVGDHADSSSPTEASFWPIHPTLERLLQYKSLARPFTSLSFKAEDDANTSVCIYDGSKSSTGYRTSNCKGHHSYDVTFWKSVVKSTDGSWKQTHLTNEEVLKVVLPSGNYSVPYIYDNFLWDHCKKVGVDFKVV